MKPVSPAATYAALLPDLIQAAREVGYALAPHGRRAGRLASTYLSSSATSAAVAVGSWYAQSLLLRSACQAHIGLAQLRPEPLIMISWSSRWW
jgi:hypothetical protein